jgi:hypothetical protein
LLPFQFFFLGNFKCLTIDPKVLRPLGIDLVKPLTLRILTFHHAFNLMSTVAHSINTNPMIAIFLLAALLTY